MGNPIVHFDLTASDQQTLGDFYSGTFGWEIDYMPDIEFSRISTGQSTLSGAIMKSDTPATTLYIEVDNIPEMLAAIEARGGSTIQAATVVSETVTYATFKDPAGNTVGLVEVVTP